LAPKHASSSSFIASSHGEKLHLQSSSQQQTNRPNRLYFPPIAKQQRNRSRPTPAGKLGCKQQY